MAGWAFTPATNVHCNDITLSIIGRIITSQNTHILTYVIYEWICYLTWQRNFANMLQVITEMRRWPWIIQVGLIIQIINSSAPEFVDQKQKIFTIPLGPLLMSAVINYPLTSTTTPPLHFPLPLTWILYFLKMVL